MRMNRVVLAGIVLALNCVQVNALEKDCAIHYVRAACPGAEATSYRKCGGKPTCTKMKIADSVEKCQRLALNACRNLRVLITESKVITADYKGKPIQTKNGNDDFCLEYPNRELEYFQCIAPGGSQ